MAADGNWNLVVSTPMGERLATLSLKADGGTLTGSQMADGNTAEIFDGTVNGNQLSWKVSISDPMPLTLEFNGTVDGNEVAGSDAWKLRQFFILRYSQLNEPQRGFGATKQDAASARTAGSGLPLVHGGLRHARSEGGEGIAGGIGAE